MHQPTWSSGMIRHSGCRGPEFESPCGPVLFDPLRRCLLQRLGFRRLFSNDVVKQADHLVSSASRLPLSYLPLFFFFCGNYDGGRIDFVVRGREPSLRAKGTIAPRCVNLDKHPRGSYTMLISVSGSVSTRK
ncbi:unnamed protein product [Ectocarpus sp. 12 AP-2014]